MSTKPQKTTFKEVEYEEKNFEKGKIYARYINGSRSKGVLEERKKIIDDFVKDNTGFICKHSKLLRKIFYSIRYIDKKVGKGFYDKDIIMVFKRGILSGRLLGTLMIESTRIQKQITRIEFAIK